MLSTLFIKHSITTVQDEILARVIFVEIVQNTFWQIKYWRILHACIHIPMQEYIGGLNIGVLIKKSPKFTPC